jgi:tRNA (guanine37-N1)-methyltransferase
MRIDILTLFPAMCSSVFEESLLKKAQEKGLISIKIHNIRDYTDDKHKTADDSPYGGGPGMVMKVGPIVRLLEDQGIRKNEKSRVILLSPAGQKLDQAKVNALSEEEHLVLICGRYEGIDERVKMIVTDEISIGDYVLMGGELPALVLAEAVIRQIPGVVKELGSVENDSFFNGLLDYPHYTKPQEFKGEKVPDVLMSGNHKEI